MANTQTVGASKAFGLDDLNQWVSEREQLLGPIIEMGDGGTATAGVFDQDRPRVKSKFAKVSLKVGNACVVGAGKTLIGEGEAYILDQLMPVCLTRPS